MIRPPEKTPSWAQSSIDDKRPFGRGLALLGFGVIAVFCGSFYAWASNAPIVGAVIAPGIISVDSNVRTVQHLEGGIVEEILVREGDAVEAGQVLIRLENTMSASTRNEIQAQYFEARAAETRLVTEQSGKEEIEFPEELTQKVGDQAAQKAMNGQRSILRQRRNLLADRASILKRTKGALISEISGLEGQIESSERRLELIAEELSALKKLLRRKLTRKSQLLQLQRQQAELKGDIAGYRAAIGTAQQRMEEAESRFAELKTSMATAVVEELQTTRARAYELNQRLAAAQNIVGRTEIRSPVAGVISKLNIYTVGGVITEGQPLLDVVPVSDKLVVRATIDPLDIDQVAPGLTAQVWLSALNRRSEAPLEAVVTTVSADRITDPQTGAAYYSARVELDRDQAEMGSVPLQPGMSADVMIRTGERTMLNYISAPISRFLSRGMREE